jgi:hypothetical protein
VNTRVMLEPMAVEYAQMMGVDPSRWTKADLEKYQYLLDALIALVRIKERMSGIKIEILSHLVQTSEFAHAVKINDVVGAAGNRELFAKIKRDADQPNR